MCTDVRAPTIIMVTRHSELCHCMPYPHYTAVGEPTNVTVTPGETQFSWSGHLLLNDPLSPKLSHGLVVV